MSEFLRHIGTALIILAFFGPMTYCGIRISENENSVKTECIKAGGEPFGVGCRFQE